MKEGEIEMDQLVISKSKQEWGLNKEIKGPK